MLIHKYINTSMYIIYVHLSIYKADFMHCNLLHNNGVHNNTTYTYHTIYLQYSILITPHYTTIYSI